MIKGLLHKNRLLFSVFILLFGATDARAVSLICDFEYDDYIYEWVNIGVFGGPASINDSGQVAIQWNGRGGGAFLEPDSLFESRVAEEFEFDDENNAGVDISIKGFNNAGQVFGDVILSNEIPTDSEGNPLGTDFRAFSNGFSFVWDLDSGFRDLATLVDGISGRGEIGFDTLLQTDYVNGHTFITSQTFPDGTFEQKTTPFPFQLREPQPGPVPTSMLTAMTEQCGSTFTTPDFSNSNDKLEFIKGRTIVRRARPRMSVRFSRYWSWEDDEGVTQFNTRSDPGKVNQSLGLEVNITNAGVVEMTDFEVSINLQDTSEEGMLLYRGTTTGNAPALLAGGEKSDRLFAFYEAKKPGDATFEAVITAKGPDGEALEQRRTINITVDNIAPELSASLTFTDKRTSGLVEINEEFGVSMTISASEGDGAIDNIKFGNLFFNAANLEVTAFPSVPEDGYSLEPEETKTLEWTLKAKSSGRWRLATTVAGVDQFGIAKSDDAVLLGSVGGLEVIVTADKKNVELEEDDDGPIPVPVMIEVEIKNPTNSAITGVVLSQKMPSIVTVIERDPLADPFAYLQIVEGELVPITRTPDPIELPDIPAGESFKVSFPGQAQDDGLVKLEFSATGLAAGKTTTGVGSEIVKVSSDILLHYEDEASLRATSGSGFKVNGGQIWRVTIKVKNRSADKKLDVELLPITRGNASYAVPLPLGVDAPDVTCPTAVRRTLEPGERETFFADVITKPDGGTRSQVGYNLRAWSHELSESDGVRENVLVPLDNKTQVLLKDGSAVVEPGTQGNFHTTLVDVRDEPPAVITELEWVGAFALSALPPMAAVVEIIPTLIDLSLDAIVAGSQVWRYPEYYSTAADKTAALLNDIYVGMDDAAREAWRLGVVGSLVRAGMKQEEALDAFNNAIVNVFLPLTEAHAKGDSLEVARWYGGLAGNVGSVVAGPETLVARGAARLAVCRLAVTKASLNAATKISPRAVEALRRGGASAAKAAEKVTAATARAMPNGAVLKYAEHVRDIYGVDKRTHIKLMELAEKWKIVAVVRRRGKGAIERLRSGRYTPKPEAIKAKNVSHIDTDWLGFKPASAPDGLPNGLVDLTDEVAIRRPPAWADVESALKADGQPSEFIREVRERHAKRTKEFDTEIAKWRNYAKDDVGIPYPKSQVGADFRDNIAGRKAWGVFADDSAVLTRQKFEIQQIKAADGSTIYRPRIQRPDGTWQYVTGDVDPMAFVKPDGRPLSAPERLLLYREFPDIGIQHPETMSWTSKKGRDDYFHEFGTNNPDAEAMLAYLPNGTQIATRYNPGKSWIDPDNIERSKWFFAGLHAALRSEDPTPVDIAPVSAAELRTFISPNTTFINHPDCGGSAPQSQGVFAASGNTCSVSMTNDSGSPTLRLTEEGVLEKWTPAGGWEPYDIQSSVIRMAPQTILMADSKPGNKTLEIRSKSDMSVVEGEDAWFAVGDRVVIDPGGPNEEIATIAAFGSLVFTESLLHPHAAGEWISVVESAPRPVVDSGGGTTTPTNSGDSDNDGIPDAVELAYGLNPNDARDALLDLDGDGINNITEYRERSNIALDSVPPVCTAPSDKTVSATGATTSVDLGSASVQDSVAAEKEAVPSNPGPFTSGIHNIVWRCLDDAGNSSEDLQVLTVQPLVVLSADSTIGEGASTDVCAYLSGPPAAYPVIIDFELSGSAENPQDYTGTGHGGQWRIESIAVFDPVAATLEPTVAKDSPLCLSIDTVDDGAGEGDETLTVQITAATNAVVGSDNSQTVNITEENVAPVLQKISILQGGEETTVVNPDGGEVTVLAQAADANPNDLLLFNWNGSDSVFKDQDGDGSDNSFSFDPAALPADSEYQIVVNVSDGGQPLLSSEMAYTVRIGTKPNTTDSDGDGIENAFDTIEAANVLQGRQGDALTFLVSTDAGYTLRLNNTAKASGSNQCLISEATLLAFAPQGVENDELQNVSGYLDAIVGGLSVPGETANIVFPLLASVPEDPVYRLLNKGIWTTFVADERNQLKSAPGQQGVCPEIGSIDYQPGLTADHWCVQLSIEDGGPNDGDGANGTIVDSSGVATYRSSAVLTSIDLTENAVSPGDSGVVLTHFQLNSAAVTVLEQLSLDISVSNNDGTVIKQARLYRDANANAQLDAADELLMTGLYNAEQGQLDFTLLTPYRLDRGTTAFIIAYDF